MDKLLSACPDDLKSAFHATLSAAVRSLSTPNVPAVDPRLAKKAADMVIACQYENASIRPYTTNIVYLQIMVLMAIEAESRGPGKSHSFSFWLGNAVALAYSMRLHVYKKPQNNSDSEEALIRRIWWTLVIIDRWHALSTSTPVRIPEEAISLYAEDRLMGDDFYHLARKSLTLSHT